MPDFSEFDVKQFIGLVLYMGLVKLPRISDYWSKCELFNIPFVKSIMPRNKFRILSRFLHFTENKQMKSSNDKLFKFRDIFNYFLEVWWSNYSGGEHLNIDETSIPFRGRLNIKQYNPLKPNEFGVKAFSLADSSTGYVIRWYIYAGKEGDRSLSVNQIVLNLLKGLENQGIHLFCDNYFTNIVLLEQLEKGQISLTGTMTKRRKFLPKMKDFQKIQIASNISVKKCNNMLLTLWKDKKDIFVLTNLVGNKVISGKRYTKGGEQKEFLKPLVVESIINSVTESIFQIKWHHIIEILTAI